MTVIEIDDLPLIERSNNFSVALTRRDTAPDENLRALHAVVRPLLQSSDRCLAYGVSRESAAYRAAEPYLRSDRGKLLVTTREPDFEKDMAFWAPLKWKARGTLLFVVPVSRFDAQGLFRCGLDVFALENYRSAHNIGAMNYAQKKTAEGDQVVVALDAVGTLRWVTLFAPKPLVFDLYSQAQSTCKGRARPD